MDDQLRTLIQKARSPKTSEQDRRKILSRLLMRVCRLPGLMQSSHPDYAIALNQTLEWFTKNLADFEERPPSLEKSLVVWVNGYLKWRIRDLYSKEQVTRKKQQSLDAPMSQNQDNARTHLDQLVDPTPSLNTLDGYIEALQAERQHRQGEWIRQYVEQDPEGHLVACRPRKASQCHCQLLTVKLLLEDPPTKISVLARDFNVNNQTLYSHWKKKCLPILREIISRHVEVP